MRYSEFSKIALKENVKNKVKQMFQGFDISSKSKERLDDEFNWARKTFVNDRNETNSERVIWYMRYVKLWLLAEATDTSKQVEQTYQKTLGTMASKAGDNKQDIEAGMAYAMRPQFHTQMEHFMSLEIHSIKNMSFSWEAPQKLVRHMEAAEKEWQDKQSRLIEPSDEDEILIDFKDGYVWWSLNRQSCDIEAKAMGHCGNAAGHYGDNLLSLRQKEVIDDIEYWVPYATFILDKNNLLGEMKGRFNEKPGDDLHPYIVALLRNDIVEGIKGGGYLPQNNFNLNDLDYEEKEELVEEKPELAGLWETYRKEGLSDKFKSRLEDVLQSQNLMPNILEYPKENSKEDKREAVKIHEWDDFGIFLEDIGDSFLLKIYTIYEDGFDDDDVGVTEEFYMDVLDSIPTKYQEIISDEIGIDITTSNRNLLRDAVYIMEHGPKEFERFIDYIDKSTGGTITTPRLKEIVKDRLNLYIEAGFSFNSMYVYTDLDDSNLDKQGTGHIDKPINGYISLDDLIGTADASIESDEDDDYSYGLYEIQQSGYFSINYDNQEETRGEHNAGLVDREGKDKEMDSLINNVEKEHHIKSVIGNFLEIFDKNETRISESNELVRLKKLSGIK